MNRKMALADSAGVLAVGVGLDEAKDFTVTRIKLIEIATALKAFCYSGNIGALPLAEVRTALEHFIIEKGWGQYAYIVDAALQYVSTVDVNVDIIGLDNLHLIEIGLDNIIRQAERSRAGWVQLE